MISFILSCYHSSSNPKEIIDVALPLLGVKMGYLHSCNIKLSFSLTGTVDTGELYL